MSKNSDMAMPADPMKPGKAPEFDEYQIKSAADDIQRAHEHMNKPKLMKHVRKHLVSKKKAVDSMMSMMPSADDEDGDEGLTSTKDLRNTYNKKFGSK